MDERSQLREDAICAAILKSPFFSADNDIEMLDPNNDEEFRSKFHPANWHVFKKPHEKVNVSVLQTITEEEVFLCFAKSKGTNEVKLYLVSHEYDFDRWIQSRAVLMSGYSEERGRFVFEYDQTIKIANLLAVAEESAYGGYGPSKYKLRGGRAEVNKVVQFVNSLLDGKFGCAQLD